MVLSAAPSDVEALAADADDLTVRERPLLAASSIAVDDDDLRAVVRSAAHDVQAYARHSGNLAVRDGPLLVGTAVAVEERQRRAVDGLLVRDVDALDAVRDDDLRRLRRRPSNHQSNCIYYKYIYTIFDYSYFYLFCVPCVLYLLLLNLFYYL